MSSPAHSGDEVVALQAAKKRGVRLGRTGAEILAPKYRADARDRAKQLEPIIRDGLFDAAHGDRADQSEGENASRWRLAPADSEDGGAATRRVRESFSPLLKFLQICGRGKPGGKKSITHRFLDARGPRVSRQCHHCRPTRSLREGLMVGR